MKWSIALAVLGGIAWIGMRWHSSQARISPEVWSFVPGDAVFCITAGEPVETWKEISGSDAWKHLQNNSWFAGLTASANALDSVIRDNDLLFELIGSRSLLVSAHMTGYKQYDFLFLVDLQKASGITFLNDYLTGYMTPGISIQKEKFNGEDLITVRNASENSNLYLGFPGKYLLASYNRKVMISALQAGRDTVGTERAVMSAAPVTNNALFDVYINYANLPDFVRTYSNEGSAHVSGIAGALRSTVLSFSMDGDLMMAAGRTSINDSIDSYIRTLATSGNGRWEFSGIAPQRTAFALSLGFHSFPEFFENFEENIRDNAASYESYRESVRQVEDFLGVDLQEDFISWVGDEVALLQLQSYGQGLDNEAALIFKAGDIEKARRGLDHIEKMVRRKTPVKFKTVDHRGYSIHYLSMKGLFNVLLGRFFSRYDKPYYTVINGFVIFSAHPQTLASIIDDYLDGKTLAQSREFRDFSGEFDRQSAVLIYVNTPVAFNAMSLLADASTRVSMETNKDYIISFRQIGFQLVSEGDGFKTILAERFAAPDSAEIIARDAGEVPLSAAPPDPMDLPYIYVRQLSASSHTGYYADSAVHVKVELENGFKDGSFIEYHRNGAVKMTGHFRHDKRDGVWRLFDEKGTQVLRRTYSNGVIKRERSGE